MWVHTWRQAQYSDILIHSIYLPYMLRSTRTVFFIISLLYWSTFMKGNISIISNFTFVFVLQAKQIMQK